MVRGRGSNGEGEGQQWSSIQRGWICGSTHPPQSSHHHPPSHLPSVSTLTPSTLTPSLSLPSHLPSVIHLTPSLCLYPHTFPLSSTLTPSLCHPPHTFPLSLPSHLPSVIHPHTFPLSLPSHLPSISPSHLPFMYNTNPSTSCDLAYDLAIVIVQLSCDPPCDQHVICLSPIELVLLNVPSQ